MPRITLKDKSPEYAEENTRATTQNCDMPGCKNNAAHKAPKHRGLNEYYTFCYEHVTEYNKAWDFFAGLSNHEVEEHMIQSFYGDRPTWKYGVNGDPAEKLRAAAERMYDHTEEKEKTEHKHTFTGNRNTPEYEAMALMGLEPPVELEDIKAQYKKLAKKYHPDLNKDNPQAEELLKRINMAYTILKLAYEDYQKLPK